jgi:hypothetical protein
MFFMGLEYFRLRFGQGNYVKGMSVVVDSNRQLVALLYDFIEFYPRRY